MVNLSKSHRCQRYFNNKKAIDRLFQHGPVLILLSLLTMVSTPVWAPTFDILPGLNFIHYALEPDLPIPCTELENQLDAEIKRFESIGQQYTDCTVFPFDITPGTGYILSTAVASTLDVTGVLSCPDYNLSNGINLIGVPTPALGYSCFNMLQSIGDNTVTSGIQRLNRQTGRYQSCYYTQQDDIVTPAGTDFIITPDEAYLVNMMQTRSALELNDPDFCGNRAPVITSAPIVNATVDTDYVYQLVALDSDNDELAYQLINGPLGMTINFSNGLVSWLPRNAGNVNVEYAVSDGQGGRTTQAFEIITSYGNSANPPDLAPIGNKTALLGSTLTLQLSATDPEGQAISYMADPVPLPAGMLLNSSTGLFSFTPALNQVGNHNITFKASDGRFDDFESITITVPPPGGITRLTGKVLTDGNAPLPGVTLEIAGSITVSDGNGDYVFDNLPVSGDVRLLVDGGTVDSSLGVFAKVPEIINLLEGADNVLNPPIILLPLDVASADPVDPSTTSIITSSRFVEGLKISEPVKLTIPPGAAIDDATGQPFAGDIHISRVADPSQGPRPLPADIGLSVYIAIQPFGVTYPEPVPISFPNIEEFPPGSRMDFFALNHETGAFEKIGEGLVSADGKTVDSIGGIVKSNSWHGSVPQQPQATPATPPAQNEPAPGTSDTPKGKPNCPDGDKDPCNKQKQNKECPACSFDKQTGNLSEYHALPGYYSLQQTRNLRLEYNSNNANPKPVIPMISGFGNQAPPPQTMSMDIRVGGIAFGEKKYSQVKVEPSGIRGQFKTTRPVLQFNANTLQTGIHDYEITVECQFPISFRSDTVPGQLIVDNQSDSPFGAGWSLAGLQKLHLHSDGKVLLTTGTSTSFIYTPGNGGNFTSPPGDFTTLTQLSDGRYIRRMRNGTEYMFDTAGRQISETDRNNNMTQFRYDSLDRLERVIDPVGKEFNFSYFAGRINSIKDPLNRITRFQHDSEGNLIKIIEPNGDDRKFEYQSNTHLLTAQLDQRDNRKEYFFDFAGRIKEALLPDGSRPLVNISDVQGLLDPVSYPATRDNPAPAPLLVEEVNNVYTDHNGNVSITESDSRNIPVKYTDAVGRVTAYKRDTDSNPLETTRPNLSVINREFDSKGKAVSVREQFNGATYLRSYDTFSLVKSVTNPRNHTTTLTRDIKGNATQVVNHLGHTSTIDYENRGLVSRQETPNGLVRVVSYNAQGLVSTITETPPPTSPGNIRVSQYSYDAAGQTTQVITPDAIVIDLVYDAKGRLEKVSDNLSQSVEYFYDSYDNLVKTDTHNSGGDLALTVQQTFDSRNRLVSVLAPHSDTEDSIMQRILDNNNNITGLTDPNNNVSSNRYDEEDRLIEFSHRLNGITRYQYDTNNRITRVVAPNNVTTTYTYDVLGRRLTETSPDRGTLSYTYDVANNVTSITDGRGITVNMTYDELERIRIKTYPNSISGKNENVTYVYDTCPFGLGRLCERTDESGHYSYEYDAFGNMVKMTRTELGVSYTTEYVYDNGDNIIQMTYPSGRIVDYGRDGIRRIEAISTTVNGLPQSIIENIQYRADNKMTQCTFGNGLIDERSYDLQGRLSNQLLKNSGTDIIDERNYSFDLNGNILSRTTTPQTSLYSYDALDRIIADNIDATQPFSYLYDLNNNRLSKNQGTGLNEHYRFVTGSNRLSRQHKVTTDTQPAAANERELVFNDASRLFQLIEDNELAAEYIYNDQGQRTRKIIHHADTTTQTILYHYDGMGYLISETDETGQLIRDYIWSEGMHPMAQIDRIGVGDRLSYLHTDHLMTNRLATDQNQSVVWRWEGEAFGNTPPTELTGIKVNLRFPGQYFDDESGLFYNWFRYYDPNMGRYISSDPIGLTGGRNTFGFASQNIIMSYDPYGLHELKTTKGNSIDHKHRGKIWKFDPDTKPYSEHQKSQGGTQTGPGGYYENCHADAYKPDENVWINDPSIIINDEYTEILATNAKPGDKVTYYDADGNVIHSGTVSNKGIESKHGAQAKFDGPTSLTDKAYPQGTSKKYYKKN